MNSQNDSENNIEFCIHIKKYRFSFLLINYLLQFVSVGGNGLILFKRLLRESLSNLGAQQQQGNWDGRPNSPVVSANYDTNPPPVFNGHVHYRGGVSTRGSGKLKTFSAQGKRVLI